MEVAHAVNQSRRIPSLTDWILYKAHLGNELHSPDGPIKTREELELASNLLQTSVLTAFEHSCPTKTRRANRTVPWWNEALAKLRKTARRLFNKAKRDGNWDSYREALTHYNKELRKSKRRSWRKFCEEVNNLPECSRIQKAFSRDHSNGIGSLRKSDGTYTNGCNETMNFLLATHFPECVIQEDSDWEDDSERPPAPSSGNFSAL